MNINKIYDEIIKSFKSIGFENTATLYSNLIHLKLEVKLDGLMKLHCRKKLIKT